jgi:hypothetical protein
MSALRTYDANGNATVLPGTFTLGYDVENRMGSNGRGGGGSETYGYAPDRKRVWRTTAAGFGERGEYGWRRWSGGTRRRAEWGGGMRCTATRRRAW